MSTGEKLRFRLWIDADLVVDELVGIEDSISAAERHARRSLQATEQGHHYTLEISDPDDGDRVIQRLGTDPSRMERPVMVATRPRNTN